MRTLPKIEEKSVKPDIFWHKPLRFNEQAYFYKNFFSSGIFLTSLTHIPQIDDISFNETQILQMTAR